MSKRGIQISAVIDNIKAGSMLDELVTAVTESDRDPDSPIIGVSTDIISKVDIRSFLKLANKVKVRHDPTNYYLDFGDYRSIDERTQLVVISKQWKAWMYAKGSVHVDNEYCRYFHGSASNWQITDRDPGNPVIVELDHIPFADLMDLDFIPKQNREG